MLRLLRPPVAQRLQNASSFFVAPLLLFCFFLFGPLSSTVGGSATATLRRPTSRRPNLCSLALKSGIDNLCTLRGLWAIRVRHRSVLVHDTSCPETRRRTATVRTRSVGRSPRPPRPYRCVHLADLLGTPTARCVPLSRCVSCNVVLAEHLAAGPSGKERVGVGDKRLEKCRRESIRNRENRCGRHADSQRLCELCVVGVPTFLVSKRNR